MMKKKLLEKFIDWCLVLVYSKNKKIERNLIVLLVIGFFLRLISALNLGVLADDMLYASQSAGIIGSGIISTHSNPPLFLYLTDLSYNLLGYSTFASRFFPLIMGTLLILVMYLLSRELFDKRVALFVAFLITFSTHLIRTTFTEASNIIFFLAFLGIYCGIKYLKTEKLKDLILAAVYFGLATLTKYNAPFYVLAFLLFGIYKFKSEKKEIFSKTNFKRISIFLLIIFMLSLPFLAFNFILQKDKGIIDVYFSRIIGSEKTQKLYSGLAGQKNSFFENMVSASTYRNLNLTYITDPLIFILALGGIFLVIKNKKKEQGFFLLIFFIVPYILQSSGSSLQKHFLFMPLLFSILAGYFLAEIFIKINHKFFKKAIILTLIIFFLICIGNSSGTPPNYFSQSESSQLKNFINENVEENDLLVFDTRIYTAESFWYATPHHLLSFHQFIDFYNQNQKLENKQEVKIYVVECVEDDCGWGWVKNKPEFNSSSEEILSKLIEIGKKEVTISSYDYGSNELLGNKEKNEKFRVYSFNTFLNPNAVEQTDKLNNFYFAPYLYKNLDNYAYNYGLTGINWILHNISLIIIYLSLFLIVLSIFYAILLI
jgi:4-amino-4-deoxy-L-arabinose transferase-like glycosyltransferase